MSRSPLASFAPELQISALAMVQCNAKAQLSVAPAICAILELARYPVDDNREDVVTYGAPHVLHGALTADACHACFGLS